MADQPTGTVTLLFTDIEGSTRLLQELGRERYAEALDLHRQLLRAAFEAHDGYEVDCEGDSFFVAFSRAEDAVAAASEAQEALAEAEWADGGELRVRMGVHTGEPLVVPPKYVGMDVHRAARIMAAGPGGQVLVSQSTRDLLVEATALRDLGVHRLKDLSGPQRLFEVGHTALPPLRSLHQTNLPVQPNPLIGRGDELIELLALVRSGRRLVTLSGSGGSGKTRLALHVAAELTDEFSDGVWFVPLAAVVDPALVASAIAQVLGVQDGLIEHLRARTLLLVLDNFEQILDAGLWLSEVLATAPLLTVIVTSRERLGIAAEQEWAVAPLMLDEAVELFIDWARRLEPRFEPDHHVREIARRLDGLPLAIELAAARVKVLTAEQIENRLQQSLDLLTTGSRDAPERHRTLRATINGVTECSQQPSVRSGSN